MAHMPQKRRSNAFKKGTPKPPSSGRAKGTRNRTTVLLKDAILKAATLVGHDGKGKDGLIGYLKMLAVRERPVYARLLEKVLPMQVHVQDQTTRLLTPEEAAEKLRARGLPVPQNLLALASPTDQAAVLAGVLNDEREDGETDELDNRRYNDESGNSEH